MPEKQKAEETFEALNPQAAVVEVGVRGLRKITIYPLSLADQLKTTDLIAKAMEGIIAMESEGDIAMVSYALQVIKDNIGQILEMVTEEKPDKLLSEMSNPQLMVIVEHIFDMNYGSVAKNVQSLAGKVKKLLPSARQSPQSLNDTQATD